MPDVAPDTLDLGFLLLLSAAVPAYTTWYEWPRAVRTVQQDPIGARTRLYVSTIAHEWVVVAIGLLVWLRGGRTVEELRILGVTPWSAVVFVLVGLLGVNYLRAASRLGRDGEARSRIRSRTEYVLPLAPLTRGHLGWAVLLSISAGVCEEVLFRGLFVAMLAPALGGFGAAALSCVVFGFEHAYQGRAGILRTALVGVVFTMVIALTGSLVAAMVLHAVIDAGSLTVLWVCHRELDPARQRA